MDGWKDALLAELEKIEGLEARPSPVAGGTALLYLGREFAHFHDANELDLRLTKKNIQALGLSHPEGSVHHPGRSPNSPWIEIRLRKRSDIARVCGLVKMAIAAL
jgi:hypothetical protein